MKRLIVTREVRVPDPLRLARYRRAPELGPRMLFFSGGTALRRLSRAILDYTHNSIHLITPFDSGGSSAVLRKAFAMPAVGDLRNRLMALADRSVTGCPEVYDLFSYRFPSQGRPDELGDLLTRMERGDHELIQAVPDPLRKIVRYHLDFFRREMPDDFDLRGASVGNLILTGGYFNYQRHMDPVVFLFSKLVGARGKVRPVANVDRHLAARLEDGTVVVGQHRITGKEVAPLSSPVDEVWLTDSLEDEAPVEVEARDKVLERIRSADLICYPMGSFYTSVVANLLVRGVGDAVRETDCPKVYVPNTRGDPEQVGMTLASSVRTLFHYLEASSSGRASRDRLINFLLVDTTRGEYPRPLDLDKIRRLGVEVIDTELVSTDSAPLLDHDMVLEHLLSLV
jgi:CofD-related protein of GAK system